MTDETKAQMIAWRCPHCDSRNELLAGAPTSQGERWLLGVTHEPGCPDFHDLENTPAVEYVTAYETDAER